MFRVRVLAAVLCLSVVARLDGQTALESWSAGVAWQGPSPADRSVGIHLARRLSTSRVGNLRIEGAAFAAVGKQVGNVCLSPSTGSCEAKTIDRIGEILATLSIGDIGEQYTLKPIILVGAGAYVSRSAPGYNDGMSSPSGIVVEGGGGLRLPPMGAQLRVEMLIRKYFDLTPSDRPAFNLRLTHSW
jgi:hypothetical protein